MFQQIAIAAALKMLQMALCQFFGFCIDQEECPDGVCDDTLQAIDTLGDDTPAPTVAPGRLMSSKFEIQWDELECLTTSVKELIKCLRKFLGLDRVVG